MSNEWKSAISQDSVVWQMYVFEINKQARDCKSMCDKIISIGNSYRTTGKIKFDDLISLRESCERAISDAASLRNFIFGSGMSPQKGELGELHKDRIDWVQNYLLKGLKLPTIKDVDVRNSMIHFDERLDLWAYNSILQDGARDSWVAVFEGVFTSRSSMGMSDKREPVRCYIADEMVFAIRDEEVNILDLMKETNQIIQRIRPQAAAHTVSIVRSGAAPTIIVPL